MRKQNSNYGSLLLGLIAVLVVIIPGIVSAQMWYDSDWGYRQAIDIDNSYNPNDLINYQVEVSLDSFNFIFTDAKPDGADIRFSDANSVMLFRYWIEEWDSIGETATIWVKVPVIPAISSTTFYMYYGNPDADDMSDGEETFEFFDDFEREYTGATGWTVKTPMPEKKADCTASVYNDQLYLFGGYDRDSLCVKSYLDDTYSYDPLTDNWAPLADMPTPRWGMVAVTFDTLIHLFSGEAETGATAAHEIYNPSTDMWTPGTDVPSVLGQQGIMGIKYGDKIHLFYKQYHYEYDPITDIYTPKTDVPTPRTWGTCALVSDKIYVIGGYSYGSPSDAIDVNEVYDPLTDTWDTTKTPMPDMLYGITRENPVIDGKIYVTHGKDPGTFFATCYVYDPVADTWEQRSTGYNPRDGIACGVIDNKLYAVGGRDLLSCAVGLDYIEEYDPATDMAYGNPWIVSDTAIVKRDTLAVYEGEYGLMFDQAISGGEANAVHMHNYQTCAVDICWNMTDFYGLDNVQPQGVISLTGTVANGSLYYYNNSGTPELRWYDGAFTTLQTGSWNNWYSVTTVWDGSSSKVIINGSENNVGAVSTNSDRIYFRINKSTRYFVDLVRTRKYSSPPPTTTPGDAEEYTSLSCSMTILSPYVHAVDDDIDFLVEIENIGTDTLFNGLYAELYPIVGDCASGTVYDYNIQKRITTTPFYPGDILTGYYYYHVDNAGGSFNLASVAVTIGDAYNNWLSSCCDEFMFLRPWGASNLPPVIYGTEWGERLDDWDSNLPIVTTLNNNYPNPFNATTTISFDLNEDGNIDLSIYNLTGQKVETLINGKMEAGRHNINWDASTYSSGVYFYKLSFGDKTFTKRMTLLK